MKPIVTAALAAMVAACGLLDTNQPDIVEPGDVTTPSGAEALRVGAISDFALAHDGDGDLPRHEDVLRAAHLSAGTFE